MLMFCVLLMENIILLLLYTFIFNYIYILISVMGICEIYFSFKEVSATCLRTPVLHNRCFIVILCLCFAWPTALIIQKCKS